MKLRKILLNSTLATAIVAASGYTAQAQTINATNQQILRVGCGSTQNACFVVLATPIVTSNCTGALVSFDASTGPGRNVLATALTIRASGSQANLTIDDSGCNGPNPRLNALTIGNP